MSNIITWGDVLKASFQEVWFGVANFIPSFLAAVILFLVGWLIAVILGRLVAQVIKAIKLDVALRGAGFDKVVERGGFALNSGEFLGALVKWFFIVVSLVAALGILGLNAVTSYLSAVVLT
jgi:small-conductance mechanosensitive channel